jgi:Protein of unknown function (DUF1761)
MKILGLKPLAVLAAALGVYAAGFVIYGLIFSQAWMTLAGFTEADFEGETWRMALGPIMPIVITLGIGLLIKERGITTWQAGARLGAFVGGFFLCGTQLYSVAYGLDPLALYAIDAFHLMLNGVIAGAILGAMKAGE